MKKKFLSIMAAALVFGIVSTGTVVQASEPKTSVQVNIDGKWQSDVITLQGNTLVPLVAFNDPSWASYSYTPKTKTIHITGKAQKIDIQLTVGSKEIKVNGSKQTLDVPVTVRNDRTYVPLRFLSEQLGGSVYYHTPSKQTIVRTPSHTKQMETLMQGNLADARRIAISLPMLQGKGALAPTGEGFTSNYIFPEGEALRYIREYRGLVEYVEINEKGYAEVKWATDMYAPTGSKKRVWGTEPQAFGDSVYFTDQLMNDRTYYGTVDSSGKSTQLGEVDRSQPENKNTIIVSIDGEKREDSR